MEEFTHLGLLARTCLSPGRRGQVLAAFSKAIYLLTDSGQLFWLVSDSAPMHRRCAAVSGALPSPSAGARFHVRERRLWISPDLVFDLEGASLWREPRLTRPDVLQLDGLPGRLHALFSALDLSQARGFGLFIPSILSLSRNEPFDSPGETADPILRAAWPFVLGLARSCLGREASRISGIGGGLVGLGAGLTPSGDDFLGGLLFAMQALQRATSDPAFDVDGLDVERYRPRTNVISFTLLKDLAAGHALAPLHHIVNGLLGGEPLESIHPFISQLTRVGGSTGWDLLAGLLTGLLSAYPSTPFVPVSRKAAHVEA